MRDQWKRVYWATLASACALLGYEVLTNQVYGDNSIYLAVVFFGVGVLSLGRLASVGRGRTTRVSAGASRYSFIARK